MSHLNLPAEVATIVDTAVTFGVRTKPVGDNLILICRSYPQEEKIQSMLKPLGLKMQPSISNGAPILILIGILNSTDNFDRTPFQQEEPT